MTAEIVVINRNGVAMAADSAVTIGRERVWQTANKLFSLSPYNDIGIMIYGAGSFQGHSWETIIKCFRQDCGTKEFQTVEACTKSFIAFLKSNKIKGSESNIYYIFLNQLNELIKLLNIDKKKTVDDATVQAILKNQIKFLTQNKILLKVDKKTFFSKHKKTIREFVEKTINEERKEGRNLIKLSSASSTLLAQLCYEIFRRQIPSGYQTGIVIAGFGKKEYFPCLANYIIDGKYEKTMRGWLEEERCHDLNEDPRAASIIPFAQQDVFDLFMQGIAPANQKFLIGTLNRVFKVSISELIKKHVPKAKHPTMQAYAEKAGKDLLHKFRDEFEQYRKEKFINPILKVISALPKEEMAAMAEAMVELTSLRRKVDSQLQSVGGPTDVAVISKGDGLIWVKRKHYFNLELNHDFVIRKNIKHTQKGGKS